MANLALAFDILARDKASATFSKVGDTAEKTGKRVDRAGKDGGKGFGLGIGKGIAVASGAIAGLGLAKMFTGFIGDARESAKIGALTSQVIKTTGGAAKISAKQVGDLATAISNKTGADDEAIQSASNLLLTFTNIRNETGKGNDVFNQATQAALDMSTVLGTDAKASAVQLGKALNDPVKGITALSKSGVSFTEQQKDQIKTLVKSGDTLGAQKLILGELGKEFGGAAAAAGTPMDKLRVTLGNLGETVGGALLPKIDKLARFFTETLIPAATQVYNSLFKGDFTGGGPFEEDSTFIANVFAVRDAFIKLIAFVKAEVIPRLQEVGSFLMGTVVPALIDLAKFIGRNKDFFVPFAATIGVIVAALKIWTAVQTVLNIVLAANPLGLVVIAIAALVAGLVLAYKRSETFRNIVNGAFTAVQTIATAVFNWIKTNWPYLLGILAGPFGLAVAAIVKHRDAIFHAISNLKTGISQKATGMWDGIKDAFKSAINWIIDAWNGLQFKIPGFDPPGPGPKFGGFTLGVPDIPRLADGGIVKASPGGTLALLGEGRYDEMVTPLGPGSSRGGFQHHGDIIIQKADVETDPQAVSRALTNRAFLMGFT